MTLAPEKQSKSKVFSRVLGLSLIGVMAVALVALGTDVAHAEARLKRDPMPSGAMVKLGDLFDGVSDRAAGTIIARAPAQGSTLSFDARALAQRARAAGVVWTPPAGLTRIVIGDADNDASYAKIDVAAVDEVPMLARPIAAGEIIASADVVMGDPGGRVPSDAVTELTGLIGQAARRALVPGRLVRASDVRIPLAVKKGDTVTLIYTAGAVRLTARGRALADASVGEPVRVLNPQSNRTVDAFVTASGEARVSPPQVPGHTTSLPQGAF